MEATTDSKECTREARPSEEEETEYCSVPTLTPEHYIESLRRTAENERKKYERVKQIYQ
jgi:hypothetical protein